MEHQRDISDLRPQIQFDYSNLDRTTCQFILQKTGEIRTLMRRTAQDIFLIGKKLIEIKERLEHGHFLEWLEAEFAWSDRTARNFMRVAEVFKMETISDLQFAPSALYILAASSIPERAREEAVDRALKGETISKKTAQEIKQKYTRTQELSEKKVTITSPTFSDSTAKTSQEIVAIIPKQPQKRQKSLPSADPNNLSLINQFSGIEPIEPESWWQIQKKHLLYCGNPTSAKFKRKLPDRVALSLFFPPHACEWPKSLSPKIRSAISLFTIYRDLDLKSLQELIELSLLLFTDSEETVVFSFLQEPELVSIVDNLGCRCFIAEPNIKSCHALLAAWSKRGGCVEQIQE